MEIYKKIRCLQCDGNLNNHMQCELCGVKFCVDKNNVWKFLIDREDNKEVEETYNLLGQLKESKHRISQYSMFLNYGIIDDCEYRGAQEASQKLIKRVSKNVEFEDKNVLEVGCGRGGNLCYVNYHFNPACTVGIDISYENVLFCNSKRLTSYFFQADAQNLPFKSNSFDIVLNIESALHYANILAFYNEVERVLCPNGIFIYVDIVKSDCIDTYINELRKRSLEVIEESDYSEMVLNSMQAQGLDKRVGNLFNHCEMYNSILRGEEKYIA